MPRPVKILLPVLALVAVVLVLVVTGVIGGDESVTAKAGDDVPAVADLDRSDTSGADTLQAYLQASLRCGDTGADVRDTLSGGKDPLRSMREKACGGKADGTWADEVKASLTDEDADSRGRQVWKVSGLDGAPDGYRLVVRMPSETWEVQDSCVGPCPRTAT